MKIYFDENPRRTVTIRIARVIVLLAVVMALVTPSWETRRGVEPTQLEAPHPHTKLAEASILTERAAGNWQFKLTKDMAVEYVMAKSKRAYRKQAQEMVDALFTAAEETKLPVELLVAVAELESSFDPTSTSPKGAVGLMQVNHKVWLGSKQPKEDLRELGIAKTKKDLYDPTISAKAGAYILNHYKDQAEKEGVPNVMEIALTRYNGGGSGYYGALCRYLGELTLFVNTRTTETHDD